MGGGGITKSQRWVVGLRHAVQAFPPALSPHRGPQKSQFGLSWWVGLLVPGTPTSPGLPSFLQESECFLNRELGYFSQYVAWVKEEVSGHRLSWPQSPCPSPALVH